MRTAALIVLLLSPTGTVLAQKLPVAPPALPTTNWIGLVIAGAALAVGGFVSLRRKRQLPMCQDPEERAERRAFFILLSRRLRDR